MSETTIDGGRAPKKTGAPQLTGATSDDAPPRHRPVRKPFGSQEQKLAWAPVPGMHLHWFNEIPGRIERAKQAGYQHVTDADGKNVHTVVGVSMDGTPLTGFLMQIPQEWYEEDMARDQAEVDKLDRSIRRGDIAGSNLTAQDSESHFYVGKQGIHFKEEDRRPGIRR